MWLSAMTTATLKSAIGAPTPLSDSNLRRDVDRKRFIFVAAQIHDYLVLNLGGLLVRAGIAIPS